MNIAVPHGLLLAALEVVEDAENLTDCNCLRPVAAPPNPLVANCDGTCTHAQANDVKAQLESLLTAHGLH